MPNRRPTWRDIVVPLVLGIFSLAIVMRRPRFANIEKVDALELIAAGVMFGLAVRALRCGCTTTSTPHEMADMMMEIISAPN